MNKSVTEIAADIFNVPAGDLQPVMTPDDIDTWDSLNHMRLITAIEAEFDIRLSMKQIQNIQALGDFDKLVDAAAK